MDFMILFYDVASSSMQLRNSYCIIDEKTHIREFYLITNEVIKVYWIFLQKEKDWDRLFIDIYTIWVYCAHYKSEREKSSQFIAKIPSLLCNHKFCAREKNKKIYGRRIFAVFCNVNHQSWISLYHQQQTELKTIRDEFSMMLITFHSSMIVTMLDFLNANLLLVPAIV